MDTKEVMLDDITFENCGQEDIPGGSERLTCDFEQDTCSWYHDYSSSLLWDRNNGRFEDVSGNGKTVQMNLGVLCLWNQFCSTYVSFSKGYFMLVKAKYNTDPSSVARLMSFPQPGGQTICVSFFYLIFGNSIGEFCSVIRRLSAQNPVQIVSS